jgi:hypothetical protein
LIRAARRAALEQNRQSPSKSMVPCDRAAWLFTALMMSGDRDAPRGSTTFRPMSDQPASLVSRHGRAARAVVAAAIIGLAGYGSVRGHDAMFPFGPMSQYDQYVPPDGTVGSITVWADTTAGTHIKVELDPNGVGIKRADVEAQLPKILAQPDLLASISTAQRRLHPHQPQFVRLYVINTVTQLHNRVPAGTSSNTLLTWDVPS